MKKRAEKAKKSKESEDDEDYVAATEASSDSDVSPPKVRPTEAVRRSQRVRKSNTLFFNKDKFVNN